jgi:hypothetical protein
MTNGSPSRSQARLTTGVCSHRARRLPTAQGHAGGADTGPFPAGIQERREKGSSGAAATTPRTGQTACRRNEGQRFSDGRSLSDPYRIYPGGCWSFLIPMELTWMGPARATNTKAATTMLSTMSQARPRPAEAAEQRSVADRGATHPAEASRGDSQQDHHQAEASRPQEPVVELPSGLPVAASFASGLLTAHLPGRLHRRRFRRLRGVEFVEPAPTSGLRNDARHAKSRAILSEDPSTSTGEAPS